MISVKVLKNKIEIKGHALYDDYGKDIVCSAVSSIVTTTINVDGKDYTIEYNQESHQGYIDSDKN